MARYRKVYITATRGTSKSFLNILSMYLKCIFFAGIKLSLAAPQKEQAATISQENITAIWNFIPILKNEIKKESFAKDFTRLTFRNNSVLDVVMVGQGSRGLRRHGLSFEEICQMEKHRETIGEVLLPLLANNRKGADGKVSPFELHKNLMYVTTASSRQSYAWEQLMGVMMEMALGKSAFVIGNSYELPVMFDQLDPDYIEEVRNDPSINPLQFAREYISQWTGSSDNSLVQLQDLEKCRVLDKPEFEKVISRAKNQSEYIIAVDVARSQGKQNATTAIAVFKITDRGNGKYVKWLVNLETYSKDMHFDSQGLYIKELVEKYDAKMLIVDGNGIGSGLVDVLVKEDKYPSYSVVNDDEGQYDGYKLPNSIPILYNLKSTRKETKASDIHNNFMRVIKNHDLKILLPELDLRESRKYKSLKDVSLAQSRMLKPFVETSLFVDEVMNLTYEERAGGTTVKRVSNKMDKDRYSAVSYGLYYIYMLEQENQKKKREVVDATGFLAIKQAKFKPRGWS